MDTFVKNKPAIVTAAFCERTKPLREIFMRNRCTTSAKMLLVQQSVQAAKYCIRLRSEISPGPVGRHPSRCCVSALEAGMS